MCRYSVIICHGTDLDSLNFESVLLNFKLIWILGRFNFGKHRNTYSTMYISAYKP